MTTASGFDLDELLADCRARLGDSDPRRAIREVIQRAVTRPDAVGDALRPRQGGFTLLLHEPDLTVLHVVWAPGMRIYPHDHRMWATIGIYAGREDNAFYRRATDDRSTLVESGGKQLGIGDVVTLGDDTIHSVANTSGVLTAAIHVYGGDFVNEPRSQWGPGPERERPYDVDQAQQEFAAANRAWLGHTAAT
jgi:predicted metal-dependent enzyme (double-stranded beta helix superfamily)